MKRLLVFGLVTVAGLANAWAQPDEDEDVDQDELDREVPPGFDEGQDPEPEPPPDRTKPTREREAAPEPTQAPVMTRRPEGMSVAIGAGWTFPSDDLLAPDVTSVRLRLRSGLTFEPLLHLSRASVTDDDGTTALTTTVTDLSVSLLARYPYRINNRVDLALIGGLELAQVSTDREMMMPDTSSTSLGLAWGFGLDYWIKPHWAASFTALNPFASLTKTTTDTGGIEASTSANLIGIIFDPTVLFTIHLYL